MTGKRPSTAAERDERLRQYAQLRDQGIRRFDAAREVGVASRAGDIYERWYRQQRGLPPPRQQYWPSH